MTAARIPGEFSFKILFFEQFISHNGGPFRPDFVKLSSAWELSKSIKPLIFIGSKVEKAADSTIAVENSAGAF
jgi:hypothetical protein